MPVRRFTNVVGIAPFQAGKSVPTKHYIILPWSDIHKISYY